MNTLGWTSFGWGHPANRKKKEKEKENFQQKLWNKGEMLTKGVRAFLAMCALRNVAYVSQLCVVFLRFSDTFGALFSCGWNGDTWHFPFILKESSRRGGGEISVARQCVTKSGKQFDFFFRISFCKLAKRSWQKFKSPSIFRRRNSSMTFVRLLS